MADFNIRTDAVDVEQIMRQIRARIREKRGVDYTEEQIQELASVKLERFLDPQGVRSDLVERFKSTRPKREPLPTIGHYTFEEGALHNSHRVLLRLTRWLFKPFLKLFFNANRVSEALQIQAGINEVQTAINDAHAERFHVRDELDALYYEVVHNLVIETTRLGIEVKNLKMRIESFSSRLDFDERRARALEGLVQSKPAPAARGRSQAAPADTGVVDATASDQPAPGAAEGAAEGDPDGTTVKRRRRRRRGRRGRGNTPGADATGATTDAPSAGATSATADAPPPDATSATTDSPPPDAPAADAPAGALETPPERPAGASAPDVRDVQDVSSDTSGTADTAADSNGSDPVPSDQ